MEIFAQLLDDLDDAVLCIPLAWERLRRLCLEIGFGAALILLVSSALGAASALAPAFASVAAASVAIWIVSLLGLGLAGLPRLASTDA